MTPSKKRKSRKIEFKILTDKEVQDLVEKILSTEGLVIDALPKLNKYNQVSDMTQQTVRQICQDLSKIVLIGQQALHQHPLAQDTLDQLSEPLTISADLGNILKKDKELNKHMVFSQLPILLNQKNVNPKQLAWLKIAIYLTAMMYRLNKTSYYKELSVRFKLPITRSKSIYTWLNHELPDIKHQSDLRFDTLIAHFKGLSTTIVSPQNSKNPEKDQKQKRNQVGHIALYLELITGKKTKKSVDKEIKDSQKPDNTIKNNKPIVFSLPSFIKNGVKEGHSTKLEFTMGVDENLVKYEPLDTENNSQPFRISAFSSLAIKPNNIFELMFIEELADNFEPPIISSEESSDNLTINSAPLQIKELNLTQHSISAKEQHLITHTSTLTPVSYQEVFARFVTDADIYNKNKQLKKVKIDKQIQEKLLITKNCASVFLLSMLTATSVDWLIQPNILTESKLFAFGERHARLEFLLGITRPKYVFRQNKYENQYDVIKLPMPQKLLNYLASLKVLPTSEELQIYLSSVRQELGITYLSKQRVESSLQIILKHYVQGCNSHIADLLSRVPLNQAPGLYYSSHTNEELVAYYRKAIDWLNKYESLDIDYIKEQEDFTTGSGFALKIEYVRQIFEDLQKLVLKSSNTIELFNRYSIYVWLIFCVLTGVRPNNEISHIHDIDMKVGWLMIDDKPNRAVKSHRLIPLCQTLIQHLKLYRQFLSDFRHKYIHQTTIVRKIETVLFGLQRADDKAEHHLLNLIANNAKKVSSIERGQVAQLLEPIIDLSPYWTRHFVRTQLEKRQMPMPIINEIIGHERHLQQALGEYSGISKSQIKQQAKIFDDIADELGLGLSNQDFANEVIQRLRALSL